MKTRLRFRCSRALLAAIISTAVWSSVCDETSLAVDADPVSTPTIVATPAQHGALIVNLASPATGETIYYTVDGSSPDRSSQIYRAPFLVARRLTVKAIATAAGNASSSVAIRTFSPHHLSGKLVWSEEFTNMTGANAQPDPTLWGYQTGHDGLGNREEETYCAWGESQSPCSTASPNSYVGADGYLHILARQPSSGVYTSARVHTLGRFSLQYGRLEVRALVPEGKGLWPAIWLLGNDKPTVDWPMCGEMDVLERVNAATTPDWNEGSVHGPGFIGGALGTRFYFPVGQTAAQWHTYGMIWSRGSVSYYIDDPKKPYVTYTPDSLSGRKDARWPFDSGQSMYIILNLAVGGNWPGSPDVTTKFPAEMLVDYVRIYSN